MINLKLDKRELLARHKILYIWFLGCVALKKLICWHISDKIVIAPLGGDAYP